MASKWKYGNLSHTPFCFDKTARHSNALSSKNIVKAAGLSSFQSPWDCSENRLAGLKLFFEVEKVAKVKKKKHFISLFSARKARRSWNPFRLSSQNTIYSRDVSKKKTLRISALLYYSFFPVLNILPVNILHSKNKQGNRHPRARRTCLVPAGVNHRAPNRGKPLARGAASRLLGFWLICIRLTCRSPIS